MTLKLNEVYDLKIKLGIFQAETKSSFLLQKKRHVSAFLKLHGDEVKFVEFKQDSVEQVAQDLADLLTGKKERIEYADQGKKKTLPQLQEKYVILKIHDVTL